MKIVPEYNLYTPEMAGSGQYGTCVKCKREPTKEGHDGCMGKLQHKNVMNACCGHGIDDLAYVQRWTRRKLMGQEAIDYINENKHKHHRERIGEI